MGIEPTLHIRLLGGLSLAHGDRPVTGVSSPRLHSLLAYLLMHRDTPQLRQHLAFIFWPDSSEAQARNDLRQILHELRHALPDADRFLVADTRTAGWRADAGFALDVASFEAAVSEAAASRGEAAERAALDRAVALYRGDLLPGCYDGIGSSRTGNACASSTDARLPDSRHWRRRFLASSTQRTHSLRCV